MSEKPYYDADHEDIEDAIIDAKRVFDLAVETWCGIDHCSCCGEQAERVFLTDTLLRVTGRMLTDACRKAGFAI